MNWKDEIKKDDDTEGMLERIEDIMQEMERIVDGAKGNRNQVTQLLNILDKCLEQLNQYKNS